MFVNFEPIIYVLRCGEGDFGVTFDFAATVIIRGDTAELIGARGTFHPSYRSEIQRQLGLLGVTSVVFERRKPGSRRLVKVDANRTEPK